MIANFFMPTRLVHGPGALSRIGELARGLGMARPLVVSDPAIAATAFYRDALATLRAAGLDVATFEGCGIDARLAHVDGEAARVRSEGRDGVIAIGGGSVICTAKGIAIVAPNGTTFADMTGVANFRNKALPMIMAPTTAGSGSEVSQFTLVKDEASHRKLVGGGPLSFPDVAILDPVTLATLPPRAAAGSAVDALTHAVEALFSFLATPLTDALALESVRLQAGSMRRSILSDDERARADNLLASSMANMACGNARLGLAHTLSLPLEAILDLPHTIGVGVLIPRVVAFNAPVAPEKARALALALGAAPADDLRGTVAAIRDAFFRLFEDVGTPTAFTQEQLPQARIAEMAAAAIPGLYGGAMPEGEVRDGHVVHQPGVRRATVAEARALYAQCYA
ncbi:iron-containing alcohol dehydrogenase [Xanthobacter tagetidis]|uniref:Iron-containing alcohol dehydrogenase n=1 Tax=Xanthobacter tagetidis TaxID=60216 RepID=A0A3L7AAX1_9HYPH|nr:iron-containing alcohol dehydrogenase [Xanthobacter tagetidis]MBB6306056.1 alcohol dehydrogenase class IV [Xanthobacter tagetidis]RLP77616.1 iron-containing alcohol dehydrogenase [Xanthobacter tagetidis]